MHGEEPEVDEKRASLAGADELAGLVGHAFVDVPSGFVLDLRIGDEFPGREVATTAAGAGSLGCVRPVDVEALVARLVGVSRFQVMAEVPLAKVRRRVTRNLECFGERMVVGLEAGDAIGDEYADFTVLVLTEAFLELHRRQMADGRGDAGTGRVLAGQDARASRRAERAGGIRLREPDAAGGQAIEVGRLMILAAEAGEVAPAEVVGQDQDDIRLICGDGRKRGEEDGQKI